VAELRIGINPRDAEAGAKRVQNALDRVAGSARKTTTATKKTESGFEQLKRGSFKLQRALGALGLAFGALALARQAKESVLLAARYETLGVVMDVLGRNVGKTATEMAALESGLRKTGISAVESRNNIARMIGAQIDLANATDLARIAQDAAVIAGIDSSAAFEQLVTGISTGQSRVLRSMGLFIDFGGAVDAAGAAAGRAADSFTEMEKTQIRANAVLEGAGQIAGAYESALETAGKQLGSMRRHISDLMVALGNPAMPTFTEAVFGMSAKIKEFTGVVVENQDVLTEWAGRLADAFVSVAKAIGLVTAAWLVLQIATWAAAIAPTIIAFGALTLAVNSLSGAFVILQLALGPVGWFTLAVGAIATGIYLWRRAHDGQASELRTIGDAANEAADGIWNLNNAQLAAAMQNGGLNVPGGLAGGGPLPPRMAPTEAPPTATDFDTVMTSEIDALNRSVRDVAVTFARYTPQFESLSAPGGLPVPDDDPFKAPPSGFRGPRFPDKKGGGMLSGAMDALGSGMDQLWAKFGPAGLAIAALFDIVSAALKPLQPVIDALREPLKIVGTLIGQTLAPVLELLVPVVKAVAVAFTIGQQAMGYLIQALGWFIDHLVPDFISNVGQGMEQWGKDMVANSKAARKAIGATNDFTDAITAATVNIPKALPLAFLRQQAGRNNTGTTGGVGTTGVTTGVGGEPHDDDTLMSRRETWNIVVNGAVNAKETAQAVMDEIRRAKGRGQSIELDRHYQLRTT